MSTNKQFTELQMQILESSHIDCVDVVRVLGDYQDNELPDSLRLRVDEHLCNCSHCRRMERGYRNTVELAQELADKPVPLAVQNRLRQALNRRLGLSLTLFE